MVRTRLTIGIWASGVGLMIAAGAQTAPPAAPSDAVGMEFFEKNVRPVLAEKCFACHGAKQQQAGLRLDSRAAMLKGGMSGAKVLVPGNPDASGLIRVLHYNDKVKMPPSGKLSEREITALTAWVKAGAPWTETVKTSSAKPTKPHWAFQSVKLPALPTVKNKAWVRNPIDAFVLAKLESRNLKPSPPADRRTLLRRVTYDLTGLPPTIAEVDTFLADKSPNAYEKVVDRLLASPAYGERWGRHWLDLARYADTKGYVYEEMRRYPFSYTYRDWVIRAFNDDLPYNRFLTYQIAADCLPGIEREKQNLAALGFFTVGRRFVNNLPDVIDDRIDVLMRSTQGLTVTCARCHDHKFDPIPTKDYYALYGVFAGSTERTIQTADIGERTKDVEAYEKELKQRQANLDAALEKKRAELSDRLRKQVELYLPAVPDVAELPGNDFYVILSPDDLNPAVVRRWRTYISSLSKTFDPIWTPWHVLEKLDKLEFAAKAPVLARQFAANADPKHRLNPLVARLFEGAPPADMHDVAKRYGKLLSSIDAKWRERLKSVSDAKTPPPSALDSPDEEALRQTLYPADSAATIPPIRITEIEIYFDEGTRVELNKLQSKVDEWYVASPVTPPHALTLSELPPMRNPRVFLRGNPRTLGEETPRQFLLALSDAKRQPFVQGNGRLELARAIASPNNPLTARVMVNRVWLHHFGQGLVRTPSDFGKRAEPPTHPELLDWLAAVFATEEKKGRQEERETTAPPTPQVWGENTPKAKRSTPQKGSRVSDVQTSKGNGSPQTWGVRGAVVSLLPPPSSFACGWSIKKLHQLIVTSATYRQAAGDDARNRRTDPDNRLLWRYAPQRLDWEAMRDSLLQVSGQLDSKMGGMGVELTTEPFSGRRTVYGLIDRQNLPAVFRAFDFADPDAHAPQRHVTLVPQQALYLLNSPFVAQAARKLAALPEIAGQPDDAKRLEMMYRRVYQRLPTAHESEIGLRFLQAAGVQKPEAGSGLSAWEKLAQALLLANEFVFVE